MAFGVFFPIISTLVVFAVQWGMLISFKNQTAKDIQKKDIELHELKEDFENFKERIILVINKHQKEMTENLSTLRDGLSQGEMQTSKFTARYDESLKAFKETLSRIEESTKGTLTEVKRGLEKLDDELRQIWKQQA